MKRKSGRDRDAGGPRTKRSRGGNNAKPIIVVLPGSSSNLTRDMAERLVPALLQVGFDIRIRPGSSEGGARWSGWNPSSNARAVVEDLGICPREADAPPWYVLGCSFGNRVACSIVSDELTPVPPRLILTGYPMYGPGANNKEARVEHIQGLPASAKVLAVSGAKDECLTKNVPCGSPTAAALWERVIGTMPCADNVSFKIVENGGHGVYEAGKSQKVLERNAAITISMVQWITDFASHEMGDCATGKNK